jgi:hypothetical protein
MAIITGMRSGSYQKKEGSPLAEGIILQAIEDLYDDNEREDCIAFFRSRDFTVCAEMAGIDTASQVRLLDFVKRVIALSARHQVRYKATHNPELLISTFIAFNAFICQFTNVILSLTAPVICV